MYFGLYDTLKPLLLGADAGVALSFALGWAVTITAGLMSYPIGECVLADFLLASSPIFYFFSRICRRFVALNFDALTFFFSGFANLFSGL
jgi:solute carrier family 25 (adenine nucleotide translocator) protein 4/5/6/31